MPNYGYQPTDKVWNPGVKLTGIDAPGEEWAVDPHLPPLATDPYSESEDFIVIPRGRLLAVKPVDYTTEGRRQLTLADGDGNKPIGFNESNIFRKWAGRLQEDPLVEKQALIEVPYVLAINDAYSGGGKLTAGDLITAYYGSVSSRTASNLHKGKPVKWIERAVYNVTTAASASVALTNANLPGMQPRILMAWNGTTAVTSGAASLTWNELALKWHAVFGQQVTLVMYDFGQSVRQIAGEVVAVEKIDSTEFKGWLKWVTDDFRALEIPPMFRRVNTTAVTDETPSSLGGGKYQLANRRVVPYKTVSVKVTGTLLNDDGTTTALSTTELALADVPVSNYLMGKYYTINPTTGEMFISNNVTVSAVTVSYSYETFYNDGTAFGTGVINLTDGHLSGIAGTPSHLDFASVVGALRAIIY